MLKEPTIEKLHAMRLRAWPPRGWSSTSHPTPSRCPSTSASGCSSTPSCSPARTRGSSENLREAKLRLAQACVEGIDYPARASSTRPWCAARLVPLGAASTRR